MADHGYDISDFRAIDPLFGTMNDFDKLIREANGLDIKIIMDFVPNHSSDEHEWFEKSVKRIDPYTDYYVWHDGKIVNGTRQPPNNWTSEMAHSSAWEWHSERKQYYYHQFTVKQPDLNYRNPKVVQEMKDILIFWMKKGVAGFRVDAISPLFEDEQLRDEPVTNKPDCPVPSDKCYKYPIYTRNLPETFDMVVQWRDVLKEYAAKTDNVSKVMMVESYESPPLVMKYYGNSTHDGACFPFNFQFIPNVTIDSNAHEYKALIDKWMDNLPEGRVANWVLGNHDRHRVGTRLGPERIDSLNMLIMTLPGVGVTYQGEEIGMEDGFVSWEDTQDPNALNAGEELYLNYTRDPERTPFHWDGTKNAGFSTANKTWLPVSEKYKETNVKLQSNGSIESHLEVYRQLIQLRVESSLKFGELETLVLNDNVLIVVRILKENKTIVSILNLGKNLENIKLNDIKSFPSKAILQINSVGANYKTGYVVTRDSVLPLKPYEGYVFLEFNN
ncbi:maltase A1-like [Chrysoperla carnea]|uniref:maltase A1-like n=1 Tax=Chrysoperla carnea TaxID=189513 RepID=UPI001D0879D8|nr:maltase A1-like [Chrysoperla carnea]